MGASQWQGFTHWNELFDALCIQQGHLDNMHLAEQICTASGNQSRGAFETAVKNLHNWRAGIHVPQRKNFIVLGKILEVDEHEGLRAHWNHLYQRTKTERSAPPEDADANPVLAAGKKRAWWPFAAAGGIVAAGVVLVGMGWTAGPLNSDPVASYEGITAEYVRNVSIRVGESTIIHGARGNDCGPAPTWEEATPLLPTLVTGRLSDGGVGTRYSRQCGGRTPARAVLFTATSEGAEQINLYGDDIVIRVTD